MPAPLPALDPDLDLSLALRTLRELSLNEGDLGYAYWTKVHDLLRAAPTMQQRIRDLEHRCACAERMSSIQPATEVDASTQAELNSRIDERLAPLNAGQAPEALDRFMQEPVALDSKLRAGDSDC
ncbi:MAG: hypothetical protein RJA34_1890 [Pseudomonadota bacterium]